MNACLAQLLIVLVHLNLAAGQCTGTSCCVGDGKPEAKTCQCWTDRSKIRNCAPGQTCDHQASKCTTPPSTPTCQANGGPESAACECGSSKAPCAVGDTCDVSGTGVCRKPQSNGGNPTQTEPSGNGAASSNACRDESSATACKDEMGSETCQAVFDSNGGRSPNCDMPELGQLALRCAKTCDVCFETKAYGCRDDTAYGVDCQQHRHKCYDAAWQSLMSQACPRTCGLCHNGACRDQMDGCCAMRHLCRDFAYRSFMSLNCGKTCGVCDANFTATPAGANTATRADSAQVSAGIHHNAQEAPSGCQDTAVNCAQMSHSCNAIPFLAAEVASLQFSYPSSRTLRSTPALQSEKLLRNCIDRGVYSLKLIDKERHCRVPYKPRENSSDISEGTILEFCFAPRNVRLDRPEQVELWLNWVNLSPEFLSRFVQASETCDSDHKVKLLLRDANVGQLDLSQFHRHDLTDWYYDGRPLRCIWTNGGKYTVRVLRNLQMGFFFAHRSTLSLEEWSSDSDGFAMSERDMFKCIPKF